MYNIPGIINPNNTENYDERIVTDIDGGFEVAITEPFVNVGDRFPNVKVSISMENGAETHRILLDKAGVLAQMRDIGGGRSQIFWGNKAKSDHGFLFRRGSYVLRAYINGEETKVYKIVSKSHPNRSDWEDYTWVTKELATTDEFCIAPDAQVA